MLRKIRILLATLFCVGITLLFLDFTGTVQPMLGWMAKLQFLPSILARSIVTLVVVIVLTLAVGRLYCSVICPLGVMQDVFVWIGRRKMFRANKKGKHANKYTYSKPKTWLRLAVLALFAVMVVAGVNSVFVLLAPYSAYGRIVAAALQPLYIAVNNLLAVLAEANGSFTFYHVEPHHVPMTLAVVAAVSALLLFILAFRNGRTYCNTICPVGTVLGYLSRYSWMKIRIDESKCSSCGMCMKNCKASCIKIEKGQPVVIDPTRCVSCGNCQTVCAKSAISFSSKATPQSVAGNSEGKAGDMSRRAFLGVVGIAAATTVKAQEKTTDGGFAAIEDKQVPERKTPLTPPGSLSARNLQQHCTACQLCISNCPNGVLRPNTSLSNLMQPVMEYDKGYCRPECTRCSTVCPAGAIRPITVEEKTAIQIGHAVVVKKNCIPLRDGKTCGNCARHCPAGAIQMVPVDKTIKQNEEGKWIAADGTEVKEREILRIPVVNTEKCIGCGACENLCPARPFSAIYVEGHEVHREV